MLIFLVLAKQNSGRLPLFDPSPYIPTSLLPYLLLDHHRLPQPCQGDKKPVTVTPLDSALTGSSQVAENTAILTPLECALTPRDASKSFRMRSYKKCRVSPAIPYSSSSAAPSSTTLPFFSFQSLTNCKFCNSFVLKLIQNARGVSPFFPKWNQATDEDASPDLAGREPSLPLLRAAARKNPAAVPLVSPCEPICAAA
jgi:hypothetical protein